MFRQGSFVIWGGFDLIRLSIDHSQKMGAILYITFSKSVSEITLCTLIKISINQILCVKNMFHIWMTTAVESSRLSYGNTKQGSCIVEV